MFLCYNMDLIFSMTGWGMGAVYSMVIIGARLSLASSSLTPMIFSPEYFGVCPGREVKEHWEFCESLTLYIWKWPTNLGQNTVTWLYLMTERLRNKLLLCTHEEEGRIWWVSICYHSVFHYRQWSVTLAKFFAADFAHLRLWHSQLIYFQAIC